MDKRSDAAEMVAANGPTAIVSVSPIILSAPRRGADLQVRVSAPVTGNELPIIVFSHGNGNSADGYAPLVNYWASRGFVVLQPTHLDSRTLALSQDDARRPSIWRFRVRDLEQILDDLELLEASVPGLGGRLDHTRIAAAGHSWGGQTVSMLLGARVLNQQGEMEESMSDSRIRAGVLLSAGGGDLSPIAAKQYPFLNRSFSEMNTPTLVIAGDHDESQLTVRGPDWFTDP
jgi:predicted dienelactone hydrolase